MDYKVVFRSTLILLAAVLISCSGGKSTSGSQTKIDSTKHAPLTFRYRFYFGSLGSMTKPHDEIWIDSTRQMTFDTHQHMKDGSWRSPRGLAYLEPRDEDTLVSFIRQNALFSIEESDVTPQCAEGDQYSIRIFRSDLAKELSFKTNTCASEYNLLTGQARKIFPLFMQFIDRLRDRYRPLFTD